MASDGVVVAVLLVIAGLGFRAEQRRAREGAAASWPIRAAAADRRSALTESTLMLVEAVRERADLGLRSPDIDAMLREAMRMLLSPRAGGKHPNGVGGMAVARDGKSISHLRIRYPPTCLLPGTVAQILPCGNRAWVCRSTLRSTAFPDRSVPLGRTAKETTSTPARGVRGRRHAGLVSEGGASSTGV